MNQLNNIFLLLLIAITASLYGFNASDEDTRFRSEVVIDSDGNEIDGNEYETVIFGNQVWMAENLLTTHYANGDEISNNRGRICVELLDDTGNPIPGFSGEDSEWIVGNSVRIPVSWSGNPALSRLQDQPIQIRFTYRAAKLYAYQFRNRN